MSLQFVNERLSGDVGQVIDQAQFKQAMRSLAGTVTIISSGRPGTRTGTTVTAVCSVSDSPPTVLTCVNRNASVHKVIRDSGSFCVNALSESQAALADRFAGRQGLNGEDRFDRTGWYELVTGAPALHNAVFVLDCSLADEHAYGTHSIFLGVIRAVQAEGDRNPLMYMRGAYQRAASLV